MHLGEGGGGGGHNCSTDSVHKKEEVSSQACLQESVGVRAPLMTSIHHFARQQVGDTQKRGKPEMRSSCRNSLDLH